MELCIIHHQVNAPTSIKLLSPHVPQLQLSWDQVFLSSLSFCARMHALQLTCILARAQALPPNMIEIIDIIFSEIFLTFHELYDLSET
jgi:hypothetical protein